MILRMKKTMGEKLTEQLFKERFNIECVPILREPNKKTADYFLKADDKIIAVCEVKDIVFDVASEENGWQEFPDGSYEKEAEMNDDSRVGGCIQSAFPQLQNYSEPKVLVIVDFDRIQCSLDSLNAAITGKGSTERLMICETLKGVSIRPDNSYRISNGKIKDMVRKIDLYFWIDVYRKKVFSRIFQDNTKGQKLQTFIWSREQKKWDVQNI